MMLFLVPRNKGHSRISMVWVPPLVFDLYCGKLRYEINLSQVSTKKKKFLQKLWTNFEKSRNPIFSKTA